MEDKSKCYGYSRDKGNAFYKINFTRPKDYEIGDTLTIWH